MAATSASMYTNPNTGDVTFDKSISATNMNMFRNKIINGDMRLDTRNAGGTAGISGGTAMSAAATDKWTLASGQHSPTITAQQVALSAADQAACGQTYAAQIQPTNVPLGLSAHFPFDGTLRDASGNNVVLTQTGTALYVPGRIGSQALYLPNEANVTAGTASVNYVTGTYTFPSSFSISFWVYFTTGSSTELGIFNTNNSGGGLSGSIWIRGYLNRIDMGFYGTTSFAGPTISSNSWIHVSMTYYSNNIYGYVNGTYAGTAAGTLAQSGFMFGNMGPTNVNRAFAGYIDDFRIYNRILTQAEINALAGLTPYQPTLPATNLMTSYFPLDGNLNDTVAANNLTGTGTITYRGGVVGAQCAYFANEATVGTATASANYASGIIPTVGTSGPITISFWMNTTKMSANANYQPIALSLSTAANGGTLGIYLLNRANTPNYYAGFYNGSYQSSGDFILAVNTWYHITIVWSTTVLSVYLNGAFNISNTNITGGSIAANTRYLTIGGFGNGSSWSGYIDDIRIFNGTALTPAQIAAIYYSTNTAYTNFQQTIDAGQIADFNWGTVAAMPATLTAWLKNNTPVAQAFSLSVNSTGLIAHLPFDNSYDDAVGAGFLSAPQVLASTAFTSTAGNFKVGSHGLDLTANTIGSGAAVSGILYSMPSYLSFSLTYSLWYKPSAYGNFQIIAAIGTGSGYFVSLTLGQSGIPYFDGSLFTGYSGANFIPTVNSWHYACIIIDSLNAYMYIDGIMFAKSSLSSSAIITTSDAFFTLGGRQNLTIYPFKGYIDDVRIYNRALTPAQVKALYDANAASTTAPTSAALTLPVRNFVYNTPSIPSNSWYQIQATLPADSTGAWETRPGQPAATLALTLGAGPSYSNVSTGVWANNAEYIGGSTQLINSSSNNFLASSSNSVLLTGVQLEKGALATGYEVRPTNMEALLSGILLTNNTLIGSLYYAFSQIAYSISSSWSSIISQSYTPKSSNSTINITFSGVIRVFSGTSNIYTNIQIYVNNSTSNVSGNIQYVSHNQSIDLLVPFTIIASYTNTSITAKTVQLYGIISSNGSLPIGDIRNPILYIQEINN